MSYYHLNVGFLNWWWRYRVVFRDPKGKDIKMTFSTTFPKVISAFSIIVIYREH